MASVEIDRVIQNGTEHCRDYLRVCRMLAELPELALKSGGLQPRVWSKSCLRVDLLALSEFIHPLDDVAGLVSVCTANLVHRGKYGLQFRKLAAHFLQLFHIGWLQILDRVGQQEASFPQDCIDEISHFGVSNLTTTDSPALLIVEDRQNRVYDVLVVGLVIRLENNEAVLVREFDQRFISMNIVFHQDPELLS